MRSLKPWLHCGTRAPPGGRLVMGVLSGKHILVVEDEPLIAMALEDMVADLGGTSAVAHSVADGLALIDSDMFDAAVLDLNLKGETSKPVAARLRDTNIPYVVATGYGSTVEEGLGTSLVAKPYVQEEIEVALSRLLNA